MPDLEQRIRDALDRLGERTEPGRIVEHVGRRKRHLREAEGLWFTRQRFNLGMVKAVGVRLVGPGGCLIRRACEVESGKGRLLFC